MLVYTQVALLAFAGALGGPTPTTTPPEFPSVAATPSRATDATAQVGAAVTRSAVQVATAAIPLYQEIAGLVQKLTTTTTTPFTVEEWTTYAKAAEAFGGAAFEMNVKDQR